MGSICIIYDIHIAVNNTKLFSVVPKTQQYVPFVSFRCECSCQQYKIVQCCHENATIRSICIIYDMRIAVNNTKLFSVVTKTQQ